VYDKSLSFFINGVGPGFSAAHTVTLVSRVQDDLDAWIRVGLTLSGMNHFYYTYSEKIHKLLNKVYERKKIFFLKKF
jgi:hypothetical protein